MPNIKAPIKGIPANATVDIVLRYPTEQLDAQGIPAPEYRIRSTDGGATWLDVATNAAPNVPASGEGDPYPTEPVEVQVTVSTLGRARTGTMWVLPVQDADGIFDLSKPISPRGWVAPATLENLISSTEAARDAALAAAGNVDVSLRLWTAAQAYQVTQVITREPATGAVQNANVQWPDGSAGVYTASQYNALAGNYDSYTVTHAQSGKTVTQPAVTRDSVGDITQQPALTITGGTA